MTELGLYNESMPPSPGEYRYSRREGLSDYENRIVDVFRRVSPAVAFIQVTWRGCLETVGSGIH